MDSSARTIRSVPFIKPLPGVFGIELEKVSIHGESFRFRGVRSLTGEQIPDKKQPGHRSCRRKEVACISRVEVEGNHLGGTSHAGWESFKGVVTDFVLRYVWIFALKSGVGG